MWIEGWAPAKLGDFAWEPTERAPADAEVLSVTKHRGFVPSLEYFGKQVFSKDTDSYKLVRRGQFAYATIHLDEGSIDCLKDRDHGTISPMYTVFDVDDRRVDRGFLLELLRTPVMLERYAAIGQGSINRRKSIAFEALASETLLLPPLPEQKKIAAILSSLDEAIQATQCVIDQTRRVKEGLLQDLLAPRRDWPEDRLGDIIDQHGGEIKTGPFGTVLKADEQHESGVPLVSVKEIRDGYIAVDEYTPRVPPHVTDRLPDFLLEDGDIVFARKRAVDRCSVVTTAEVGWMLGSDAIRVRVPTSIRPRFAAMLFQTPRIRKFILERSVGSTSMVTLSQRTLAAIPFPVVPTRTQDFVIERLAATESTLRALVLEASRLTRVKAGLLQDLLTGTVRVSP